MQFGDLTKPHQLAEKVGLFCVLGLHAAVTARNVAMLFHPHGELIKKARGGYIALAAFCIQRGEGRPCSQGK